MGATRKKCLWLYYSPDFGCWVVSTAEHKDARSFAGIAASVTTVPAGMLPHEVRRGWKLPSGGMVPEAVFAEAEAAGRELVIAGKC